MKLIKKYWFKLLCLICAIGLSIYVCSFAIKKVLDLEIYKQPTENIKIYSVWHIETFEGGGKSRIDYLKQIARNLEKSTPNTLFLIKQTKPENLESELSDSKPDIISFGFGVGKVVLPILANFNKTYDVRDELIDSGKFNNQIYAIPYIVSGYALFTHGIDTNDFHCGTTNFTNAKDICTTLNKTISQNETQYEAYKYFVNNKQSVLLGTARDVFRISNLNNIGRTNASIIPIETHTDLLQYVGATYFDESINAFMDEIFSQANQCSLTDYSLFSSLHTKLYNTGIYNDMENAIFNCEIAKVFND